MFSQVSVILSIGGRWVRSASILLESFSCSAFISLRGTNNTQIVRSNTARDNRVFDFLIVLMRNWIGYLDGMTGGTTSCGIDCPQRDSVFMTSCRTDLPTKRFSLHRHIDTSCKRLFR